MPEEKQEEKQEETKKLSYGVIIGRRDSGEIVVQPLGDETTDREISPPEIVTILTEGLLYIISDIISTQTVTKWASVLQQIQKEKESGIIKPTGIAGTM